MPGKRAQQGELRTNMYTAHLKRSLLSSISLIVLIHLACSSLYTVLNGALAASASTISISPRIVQTDYGALRGIVDHFAHQQGGSFAGLHPVEKFLGVPYATPPINGLRFMPPLTPSPWDGIKLADKVGPSCPQQHQSQEQRDQQRYWTKSLVSNNTDDEDCLYLNIFYPTIGGHSVETEKPPVVVLVEAISWYQSGANFIDASVLASRGRLMVATVNFRIGVLGFLKTSPRDNPQGNYGMLDVVAALHWLRSNAPAFGGDPGRLTLIGIGYGAALVNLLMLSPVAKGLFQGAILLGGSALGPTSIQPHPEDIRQQVASLAGCWDPVSDASAARYDLAPCLRKLPLKDLLKMTSFPSPHFVPSFAPFLEGSFPMATTPATASNKGYHSQHPSLETGTLLRDIMSRSKAVSFPDCDVLVGLATYETDRNLPGHASRPIGVAINEERRDAILRTMVRNIYQYHNNEIFAVLRNEYMDWELPSKDNSVAVKRNIYQALSDGLVVSPLMELLRYHAGLGTGRTFLYHLNYPSNTLISTSGNLGMNHHNQQQQQQLYTESQVAGNGPLSEDLVGSFHTDGVFYLLGLSLIEQTNPTLPTGSSKEEVEISEQLIAYVAGFCFAGDPNEHGGHYKDDKGSNGMVFWDRYTLAEQKYLSIGLRSRVRSHYRSHKMSVWLRLLPQLHQPGEEGVLMTHHHMKPEMSNKGEYEGLLRPYPKIPSPDPVGGEAGGSTVEKKKGSATGEVRGSGDEVLALDKSTESGTLSSSECPTQQPPYTAVATQLLNNSADTVVGIGVPVPNQNSVGVGSGIGNATHPSPPLSSLWSYTNMLIIIVATGSILLILNLAVIACFCTLRRRSTSVLLIPTTASSLLNGGSSISKNKHDPQQQTAFSGPHYESASITINSDNFKLRSVTSPHPAPPHHKCNFQLGSITDSVNDGSTEMTQQALMDKVTDCFRKDPDSEIFSNPFGHWENWQHHRELNEDVMDNLSTLCRNNDVIDLTRTISNVTTSSECNIEKSPLSQQRLMETTTMDTDSSPQMIVASSTPVPLSKSLHCSLHSHHSLCDLVNPTINPHHGEEQTDVKDHSIDSHQREHVYLPEQYSSQQGVRMKNTSSTGRQRSGNPHEITV